MDGLLSSIQAVLKIFPKIITDIVRSLLLIGGMEGSIRYRLLMVTPYIVDAIGAMPVEPFKDEISVENLR